MVTATNPDVERLDPGGPYTDGDLACGGTGRVYLDRLEDPGSSVGGERDRRAHDAPSCFSRLAALLSAAAFARS
jgi:hypothetical protein